MSIRVEHFNSKQNVFEKSPRIHQTELEMQQKPKKKSLKELRYKRDYFVSANEKTKALTGAAFGMLLPTLLYAKMQKKSIWNMKYGFNEMASMSIGANFGGVALSSFGKNHAEKEKKINEGIFQVINSVLPMALVDSGLKLCNKVKKLNNAPAKIIISALGVLVGTQVGIKFANKITDPKNLVPDRKYTAKDAIANIDDAASILLIGKVPFADKIHVSKILPAIYTYSGYRAGTSN